MSHLHATQQLGAGQERGNADAEYEFTAHCEYSSGARYEEREGDNRNIPQTKPEGEDMANEANMTNHEYADVSKAPANEEKKKCNGWLVGGIIGGFLCLLVIVVIGVVVAMLLTEEDDPTPAPTFPPRPLPGPTPSAPAPTPTAPDPTPTGPPPTPAPTPQPTPRPTPFPTPFSTPFPTPFPTFSPPSDTVIYTLVIDFDSYAHEISWTLYDGISGSTIFEESYDASYDNETWEIEFTLLSGKSYLLVMRDVFGDGLDDGNGNDPGNFAFYRGSSDGTLLWSVGVGRPFSSEEYTFIA